LRANVRHFAEAHLDHEVYLSNYVALIQRLTGQSLTLAFPAAPGRACARGR